MKKKVKFYPLLLVIVLSVSACGGGGDNNVAPSNSPRVDSGEVLSTGQYIRGNSSWTYQNLRLPNKTGGYAYAQYFKANGAGIHPVIVMTKPYAGIDWTGEPVDTRWGNLYSAHLANGGGMSMCSPDVDGPDYNSLTSSPTCYTLSDTDTIGNQALIYLSNNYSVVVAYGRFYAGGSVDNDIEDMTASLRFIGTQPELDSAQIGIIGGSWGGFEALYAALSAPAGVRPAVAVPLFPVSDFSGLIGFINNTLPGLVSSSVLTQYNAFYDPYLRRFYASTGKPPNTDYSGYTPNDLAALVDMEILIPHDDGDTILPAQFSHDFAAASPSLVEGFWYKRLDNAPWETSVTEHGQIGKFILVPAHLTFTTTYLFTRLNNSRSTLSIPYSNQDMQVFFNDIRTYQLETRDVSWLVPRLIEMCDRTIFLFDPGSGNTAPPLAGSDFVAQSLNSVWNTSLTGATVQQYLIDNGLPLP